MSIAIRRSLMEQSAFGTVPIRLQRGGTRSVWLPFLSSYALGLAAFWIGGAANYSEAPLLWLVAIFVYAAAVFAFGWYRAAETRLVLREIRLNQARIEVEIDLWKFGLLALVPGLFIGAFVAVAALIASAGASLARAAILGALGAIILVFLLGLFSYGLINLPLQLVPWTRMMTAGMTLSGSIDWAQIGQSAPVNRGSGSFADVSAMAI